jgi:periplasmic divalent cation tolerance protein
MPSCIIITPGMISHYWWEGKIERPEEAVMIVKTHVALADVVRQAVRELHSYQTPAATVLPVESLDPAYHQWIVQETGGASAD